MVFTLAYIATLIAVFLLFLPGIILFIVLLLLTGAVRLVIFLLSALIAWLFRPGGRNVRAHKGPPTTSEPASH